MKCIWCPRPYEVLRYFGTTSFPVCNEHEPDMMYLLGDLARMRNWYGVWDSGQEGRPSTPFAEAFATWCEAEDAWFNDKETFEERMREFDAVPLV